MGAGKWEHFVIFQHPQWPGRSPERGLGGAFWCIPSRDILTFLRITNHDPAIHKSWNTIPDPGAGFTAGSPFAGCSEIESCDVEVEKVVGFAAREF